MHILVCFGLLFLQVIFPLKLTDVLYFRIAVMGSEDSVLEIWEG